MDGNGRWAQARGLARSEGHRAGVTAAKGIVKAAVERGIECVSLYVFSTENWKRSSEEVGFLMFLIIEYLKQEFDFYRQNGIRVRHCGDLSGLPENVRREINAVMADTAANTNMTVNLAINYGGRDEILRAANAAQARKLAAGDKSPLSEADITASLDTAGLPDPDLIIRTANELRMSNFLLWEGAYAEFYFSEKYWPDWTAADLDQALADYLKRKRLFGGKR
jgi:undecaprenyl diphosphate synthase